MLRDSSSPETYFQAAFRVQTPWVFHNPDNLNPNMSEIMKEECYVFDFAPDRALRNDAVYKFKRYEDASLEYTGINKHQGENVGLWDTTLSPDDYIVAM